MVAMVDYQVCSNEWSLQIYQQENKDREHASLQQHASKKEQKVTREEWTRC